MRQSGFLALMTAVFVAACATSTEPPTTLSAASSPDGVVTGPESPDLVTEAPPERVPLGQLVRSLGSEFDRSIVLMNGVEYYFAGPYRPEAMARRDFTTRLAEDTGMLISRLPTYDFIYPPGFDSLLEFSPSQRLSPRTANINTSIRIGADTPLYGALALLSHSHGVTLVADNVIASALCGETRLHAVSLGDAIDAILRAARLSDATCSIDVEGEAALFYTPRADRRSNVLTNPSDTARPAALDRHVSLYLPAPPEDPRRLLEESRAVSLEICAQRIGEQLGMRIEFDRSCGRLPVNPCVMSDVTIETAMRLLIQQWPLPHYGYTATEDTIRIVYLGPPTA